MFFLKLNIQHTLLIFQLEHIQFFFHIFLQVIFLLYAQLLHIQLLYVLMECIQFFKLEYIL